MVRPTKRTLGLTILTIGAVAATNATIWTLLIPIFAVVAAFRDDGPVAPAA